MESLISLLIESETNTLLVQNQHASFCTLSLIEQTPGFKESNFQVFSTMLQLIGMLASADKAFGKACVQFIIPIILPKLADIKTNIACSKCFDKLVEAVGPGYVVEQVFNSVLEQKNPKAQSEAINWVASMLEDFGLMTVSINNVIAKLKLFLESTSPLVKSASIKVLLLNYWRQIIIIVFFAF